MQLLENEREETKTTRARQSQRKSKRNPKIETERLRMSECIHVAAHTQ